MNVESIIQPVRDRAAEVEEELIRLRQQFIDAEAPLREELRALKRILNAANPPGTKGRPKKSSFVAGNRATGTSNNARYGVVTGAVVKYLMQTKPVEFRGVDIRKEMPETVDGVKVSSSNVAEAFSALREDGVVRFVRKDGNSRYYGLTGDDPSPELLERLGMA